MTKHIVGISGSLRKGSHNTLLLQQAQQFLPKDYQFTLADISQIPLYNQDDESNLPAAVEQFAALCRSADGFLISTPEYNGQISGVLKNALDWVSRPIVQTPLALKPIAIMGSTMGMGGTARAQINLRNLLFALNMDPVNRPEFQLSQAHLKFDESGAFTDPNGLKILQQLIENLAVKVGQR
ncbi:NADPH-dependent FMN reductase [Paenibacillus mendelii]|uniref:NADPH-dependent FMN reductase n=1 Tax=Paenibacillus mendelii TaxID=206163 RepID=A0ABV6J6S7_9BACL|nr:NAD(P)H-dependent oxidoreductase [Paenibacillus mendelii]MCQ6561042.1 NAD(P)H-dependent oxidoreductase [Paenibacillus mendelii]